MNKLEKVFTKFANNYLKIDAQGWGAKLVQSIVGKGIKWGGGNGSFIPDDLDPNAIYTPSQSEILVGSVSLTMETTGNGNCSVEIDTIKIVFTTLFYVLICVLTMYVSSVRGGNTNSG